MKKTRDGIVRKVKLRYRNHHEGVDRKTDRATTQVVVIHKVEELNIIQELGQIATMDDMKKRCAELSATPAAGVQGNCNYRQSSFCLGQYTADHDIAGDHVMDNDEPMEMDGMTHGQLMVSSPPPLFKGRVNFIPTDF